MNDLVFLVPQDNTSTQVGAIAALISNLMKRHGGEIARVEEWVVDTADRAKTIAIASPSFDDALEVLREVRNRSMYQQALVVCPLPEEGRELDELRGLSDLVFELSQEGVQRFLKAVEEALQ